MSSAGAVLRAAGESHAYSIDSSSLEATCSIQETLFAGVLRGFCFFLPALFHYSDYPLERDASAQGAVAGHLYSKAEGWQLSSDIGCAFIALDGLAHYYARYPDPKLCLLLEEAIQAFLKLDKWGMKIQTHATLTATRGILYFYEATKDPHYFNDVVSLFDFYLAQGMTATYENDNWFNRPSEESWTEPCAVVDSLILSLRLYALKKDERYRILARRIFFNGLQFCQRDTGGAGPNSCVDEKHPFLGVSYYEASDCCSMRYAEGLWAYRQNQGIFTQENGPLRREARRYFFGDHLLVEDTTNAFPEATHYAIDGRPLILIPSLTSTPRETAEKVSLRVIF